MIGQSNNLVVATLNYCDIMNNPFEFYCAQFKEQLAQLGQIFVSLIPSYIAGFNKADFGWKMGKIDQTIRVGRYSPAFDRQAGIIGNKFITKEKYEEIWDKQFENIPKPDKFEFKDQERLQTRLYDFLFYHSLLVFVYSNKPFDQLIKNDPASYQQVIKPFHELSFLSEEGKLKKIIDSFTKISADIFFLQEYSQKFLEAIQNKGCYHTVSDSTNDTLIIAKKATFAVKYPSDSVLTADQLKSLQWSNRTAIAILDKYIVINAHLNSKSAPNKIQIQQLKTALVSLKQKHPYHYIILGGDLNSFLGQDGVFEKHFHFYPKLQSEVTTVKKRTMVQGQFKKGNLLVAESKDKIISTLPIQDKPSVRLINNELPTKEGLIPTNQHPFDHYVVVVQLKKP